MSKKKIKTFTVDAETYDSLVAMFKEYEAEVSVSYYVDRCLKDLLKYLRTLDDLRKQEAEKYSAPVGYVIELIAKEPKMSILEYVDEPDAQYIPGRDELDEIQARYEADRKRIPVRFWRLLRTGRFRWSADKKHVINNKTGHAYGIDERGIMTDAPEYDEKARRAVGTLLTKMTNSRHEGKQGRSDLAKLFFPEIEALPSLPNMQHFNP